MKGVLGMARGAIAAVFLAPFTLLCVLLHGCGGNDPGTALNGTASELQAALEAKRTNAVLELLHPTFQAGGQFDRAWAQQTMRGLFLRHRNVRILVLRESHRLDPGYHDRAYSEADVSISGAQGLIPDSAGFYKVRLEWWQHEGEWRLARLDWQ
jgi:hypothetical protein